MVASWRFYDDFRTDAASPARAPQVGTWSPVLDHDGANLAPALQTVLESARADDLAAVVDLALPGTTVQVRDADGWFSIELRQTGLLRPLSGGELSDGTLRFLLLAAALLSPSPPSLLVLNEPETSLHPEVLPAAADLIRRASERTQVVVVTHSAPLTEALQASAGEALVDNELYKELGETRIRQTDGLLDRPPWAWGSR
jgi:predicted ATPase